MRIVGLDLSLQSAGFAIWGPDMPAPIVGNWQLADLKHAARGCVRLQQRLIGLHREHGQLDVVAIERAIPAHMLSGNDGGKFKSSANVKAALNALEWHARSFCEAVGARYHLVAVQSWRAPFLRNIRAGSNLDVKTLAQMRAKQLGVRTTCHDEAEAFGVLDYQIRMEDIIPPWHADEVLV